MISYPLTNDQSVSPCWVIYCCIHRPTESVLLTLAYEWWRVYHARTHCACVLVSPSVHLLTIKQYFIVKKTVVVFITKQIIKLLFDNYIYKAANILQTDKKHAELLWMMIVYSFVLTISLIVERHSVIRECTGSDIFVYRPRTRAQFTINKSHVNVNSTCLVDQ
jgi:hypothetical protein